MIKPDFELSQEASSSPLKRLYQLKIGIRKSSIPSPSKVKSCKTGELCIESNGLFKSCYEYKLPNSAKNSVIFVSQSREQAEPNDQKICRICLGSENLNSMIAPCSCTGSQKHVHEECLKIWLLNKKAEDLNKCELCNSNFDMHFEVTSTCMPFHSISTCQAWVPFIISLVLFAGLIYICFLALTTAKNDTLISVSAFILGFIFFTCCFKGFFSMFRVCFIRKIEVWRISDASRE